MRRVLALIGALGMIALATFVRTRLDARAPEDDVAAREVRGTLVCVVELRPVCEGLRAGHPDLVVRVEEAGDTADRLVTGEGGVPDAWLTLAPYPDLVVAGRRQRGADSPFARVAPERIARSPLVTVAWNDRAEVLRRQACPTGIDWACLGTAAGQPWTALGGDAAWGDVKVGLPPADRSATGLLVLALGTGQYLHQPDFASNDLADGAVRQWLTQVATRTGASPNITPLTQMLAQGRAAFAAVGSIEALAGPAVAGSAGRDAVGVLESSPMVTADVVAARSRATESSGAWHDLLTSAGLRAALARNGWRVPGEPSAPGTGSGASPETNGLPNGGVLLALENLWNEVH